MLAGDPQGHPIPTYKPPPCKCAECLQLLVQLGCHTALSCEFPSNRARWELPSGLDELQLCSTAKGLQGTPVCALLLDPGALHKDRDSTAWERPKQARDNVNLSKWVFWWAALVLSVFPLSHSFIMCVHVCVTVQAGTLVIDRCIRPFLMSFKTPPYTFPLPHCMLFGSKVLSFS